VSVFSDLIGLNGGEKSSFLIGAIVGLIDLSDPLQAGIEGDLNSD
jgi:hypothetical protein